MWDTGFDRKTQLLASASTTLEVLNYTASYKGKIGGQICVDTYMNSQVYAFAPKPKHKQLELPYFSWNLIKWRIVLAICRIQELSQLRFFLKQKNTFHHHIVDNFVLRNMKPKFKINYSIVL